MALYLRGESSSDGQTILAQRYNHAPQVGLVLWCLHLMDAYQYSLPACVLLCAWLLKLNATTSDKWTPVEPGFFGYPSCTDIM